MTLTDYQTQTVLTDSDLCEILESILEDNSPSSVKVQSIREVLDLL